MNLNQDSVRTGFLGSYAYEPIAYGVEEVGEGDLFISLFLVEGVASHLTNQ